MAMMLLASCATIGEQDVIRGDGSNPMMAGAITKDSKSLVCTTQRGACFSPQALLRGKPCRCADEHGIIEGIAAGPSATGSDVGLATVVPVFFATDRGKHISPESGDDAFTNGRGENISYGLVKISIPATHHAGQLEEPLSFVRLRYLESAKRHVLLLTTSILDAPTFFGEVRSALKSAERPDALIFVHGFNNSFSDAARRTAQLSFDLGFQGVPVLFSWASQDSPTPLGYSADSQTIQWSQENIRRFLDDFLAKTEVRRLYLIAHSMGTQALTKAFVSLLQSNPSYQQRIQEVILAAPDIDSAIFRRDIAPAMVRIGAPVTVYASTKDKAMMLSLKAANYPRVGDSANGLVLMNGIETIDATGFDTGLLGHSTFAESRELLMDWNYIISQGLRAKERTGLRQLRSDIPFWTLRR